MDAVAAHQDTANVQLTVGGEGMQCEADEIAFRCVVVMDENGNGILVWIRYFGMVRRGSDKIFLARWPDRQVAGAGQGGGGAPAINELVEV